MYIFIFKFVQIYTYMNIHIQVTSTQNQLNHSTKTILEPLFYYVAALPYHVIYCTDKKNNKVYMYMVLYIYELYIYIYLLVSFECVYM
jgi:hypothetical protein